MNAQSSVQIQALWWKPKGVVLEGTTFRPLPPFAPYNPFTYHYPHSLKNTTRATKSLCYEFLRVKTDDHKAVVDFCRRYGVLGRLDNPGWIMWGMEKSGSNDFLKYLGFDEPSPLGLLHEHDVRGAHLRQIAGIAPDHSLCVPMEWDDFRRAQVQLRETTAWVEIVTTKGQSKAVKAKTRIALRERFRWKLTMVRPLSLMGYRCRELGSCLGHRLARSRHVFDAALGCTWRRTHSHLPAMQDRVSRHHGPRTLLLCPMPEHGQSRAL